MKYIYIGFLLAFGYLIYHLYEMSTNQKSIEEQCKGGQGIDVNGRLTCLTVDGKILEIKKVNK